MSYYPIEEVAEAAEPINFNIDAFASFRITDTIEFLITETTVSTWIVMGLLLIVAVYVRVKSKEWAKNPMAKPKGFQNFIEMCIDAWEKFFKSNSSERVLYLAPWFFTLFTFLLFSNMLGVTGLRPPTADWGMAFPLALSSFFLFQFAGIRHRPKAYLKGIFLEPSPVFGILNVIGELARPISLSFRLFGNVLGGMILMSLLYGIAPIFTRFLIPIPLHMYFDIFAGVLQTVIFTVLSLVFVGIAAED